MVHSGSRGASSTPTGVAGFDAIAGGLPDRRTTLVVGGPGVGKTTLVFEVLARGAAAGQKALFVCLEQPAELAREDVAGFRWSEGGELPGIDLLDAQLPEEALSTGDFDLHGLLAMVDARLDATGARRVAFDGLDALLCLLHAPGAARRELMRLSGWANRRQVTCLVTAKADPTGELPPSYDFAEYIADCVVTLRHDITEGTSQRRIRVAKLRGRSHSADEYAFTISAAGVRIASPSQPTLEYPAPTDRVSSGVVALDEMLEGGYFVGSAVLLSGAPGTAKTTLASAYAAAACAAGGRVLLVSFDESADQIVRNLRSVNIDLEQHRRSGALRMLSLSSRTRGPEVHAVDIETALVEHGATGLVIDPLSAFARIGAATQAEDAALRVLDLAHTRTTTCIATTLINAPEPTGSMHFGLSTAADTWIHLTNASRAGERNRTLSIVKSRGTGHSRQVRELVLSDRGVDLADVYTAGGEVLMGTLRFEREHELAERSRQRATQEARERREVERQLADLDERLETLRRERERHADDLARLDERQTTEEATETGAREQVRSLRRRGRE